MAGREPVSTLALNRLKEMMGLRPDHNQSADGATGSPDPTSAVCNTYCPPPFKVEIFWFCAIVFFSALPGYCLPPHSVPTL